MKGELIYISLFIMGQKKMSKADLQKMFTNKQGSCDNKKQNVKTVNTNAHKGKAFNKTGM